MPDDNYQLRIARKLLAHQSRVVKDYNFISRHTYSTEIAREIDKCARVMELLTSNPKEWQEEWIEMQRLLREIDEWKPL